MIRTPAAVNTPDVVFSHHHPDHTVNAACGAFHPRDLLGDVFGIDAGRCLVSEADCGHAAGIGAGRPVDGAAGQMLVRLEHPPVGCQ
jgi:hypothetical protein